VVAGVGEELRIWFESVGMQLERERERERLIGVGSIVEAVFFAKC